MLLLSNIVLFSTLAFAQTPTLQGTFTFNRTGSDNVETAIEKAVEDMNFIVRPIAKSRLSKTNQPYQRVVISYTPTTVSITTDKRAAIQTPSNGTSIKWTREDDEVFNVSTEWKSGKLQQIFKAEDGARSNLFSISPDGKVLTLEVTITSPKLPQPLKYKLLFNRS